MELNTDESATLACNAELFLEHIITRCEQDLSNKKARLSENEVRQISTNLRYMGKGSWAQVPRLYVVLRLVKQTQIIDAFLAQGVSDIWFPFSHKTLPEELRSASARFEFVKVQDVVLTKAFDLEREDGKHRHFSSADELPLRKLGELGKGGFGFVDRVSSTITYKEYARKRIPRGKTFKKNLTVTIDFERELSHLKKLSHNHIVELIGSYTDPKFVGILMSPVADFNLKDFLSRGNLSSGERSFLRTFFGCLASALRYLHEQMVRHKDIKPQNVLVKGHQVFLTDFGISLDWSELGQSTTTGITVKTPRYCAPEVASYLPRNSLADLWSLGCVFLEMWTILKGEAIHTLLSFLENHGTGSTCYHLNQESALVWCSKISAKGDDKAENQPLTWIRALLQHDQTQRWTAQTLVEQIQEANENPDLRYAFAGVCCISDDNSTDGSGLSKRSSLMLDDTGASSVEIYDPKSSADQLETTHMPSLSKPLTKESSSFANTVELSLQSTASAYRTDKIVKSPESMSPSTSPSQSSNIVENKLPPSEFAKGALRISSKMTIPRKPVARPRPLDKSEAMGGRSPHTEKLLWAQSWAQSHNAESSLGKLATGTLESVYLATSAGGVYHSKDSPEQISDLRSLSASINNEHLLKNPSIPTINLIPDTDQMLGLVNEKQVLEQIKSKRESNSSPHLPIMQPLRESKPGTFSTPAFERFSTLSGYSSNTAMASITARAILFGANVDTSGLTQYFSTVSRIRMRTSIGTFTAGQRELACLKCGGVFKGGDTYYKHYVEDHVMVYCHYHYAVLVARRCEGCQRPILMEILDKKAGTSQQQYWHYECAVLCRHWRVRLSRGVHNRSVPAKEVVTVKVRAEMKQDIDDTQHLVHRILTKADSLMDYCTFDLSNVLRHAAASASDLFDALCSYYQCIHELVVVADQLIALTETEGLEHPDIYRRCIHQLRPVILRLSHFAYKFRHANIEQDDANRDRVVMLKYFTIYVKVLVTMIFWGSSMLYFSKGTTHGFTTFTTQISLPKVQCRTQKPIDLDKGLADLAILEAKLSQALHVPRTGTLQQHISTQK